MYVLHPIHAIVQCIGQVHVCKSIFQSAWIGQWTLCPMYEMCNYSFYQFMKCAIIHLHNSWSVSSYVNITRIWVFNWSINPLLTYFPSKPNTKTWLQTNDCVKLPRYLTHCHWSVIIHIFSTALLKVLLLTPPALQHHPHP